MRRNLIPLCLSPDLLTSVSTWYAEHPTRSALLPDVIQWLGSGWAGVRIVNEVDRGNGALAAIRPEFRHLYVIEVRPRVTSGRWGRPRDIRPCLATEWEEVS